MLVCMNAKSTTRVRRRKNALKAELTDVWKYKRQTLDWKSHFYHVIRIIVEINIGFLDVMESKADKM